MYHDMANEAESILPAQSHLFTPQHLSWQNLAAADRSKLSCSKVTYLLSTSMLQLILSKYVNGLKLRQS